MPTVTSPRDAVHNSPRAGAASTLFAVALLFAGQNATLTGTLAGQIVMEGFVNIRLRPWLRRLITRLVAIVPAVIVVMLYGERGAGGDEQQDDEHVLELREKAARSRRHRRRRSSRWGARARADR